MSGRGSLLLAALAVGIGLFIWLWERDQPGTEQRRQVASRLLPRFDPEAIDRIVISRRDATIELLRQDGKWRLAAPLQEAAEELTVTSLLRRLGETNASQRLDAAEIQGGLAAGGLDRDATRLELGGGGTTTRLTFGTRDIGPSQRFVAVGEGGRLAVVEATVVEALEQPIERFRDHSLFDASTIDVQRISFHSLGQPTLQFERRGGEQWWLTAPLIDAADNSLVNPLVSKLLALRIDQFLERSAADPPVATPSELSIVIEGAAGATLGRLELRAALPSGARLARTDRRPQAFLVQSAPLEAELRRPASAWRSPLAVDTSVWDLAELELQRGAARLVLRRAIDANGSVTGPWMAAEPAGAAIDAAKVDALVSRLARVESRRLVDDLDWARAGLTTPAARVVLRRADPSRYPESTLVIGAAAEPAGSKEVYAGVPGRTCVLVIDAALAEGLDPARLAPLNGATPTPPAAPPATPR